MGENTHLIDELAAPIIFGHRGASKFAPENTLAAFDLALSSGAPAIELDTMLTRDGVPVVIHDRTVDRTTNGQGRIDELTLEQVRALDAGGKFSADFRGERIPTLVEVFERYAGKLLINVELKNYHAPLDRLPFVVMDLVERMHNQHDLIFSSFNPINLTRIKKVMPEAKVALLVEHSTAGRLLASRAFAFTSPHFIHPQTDFITADYIQREHAHRRRVNVWTVNDMQAAAQYHNWGIDGMIGDDPQGLAAALAN
ncbi:MAG: glycerophosphoryl diester phosphodiesterase [Chloroflexota bacterium]|nr:glycerophosphoryl diester phosphodiesterase [Chloroflexota bacterium]